MRKPSSSVAHGIHGSGERTYTEAERDAVVAQLLGAHVGLERSVSIAGLATCLGIDGRTIRQVLSDRDGIDFLVGSDADGIFVCRFREEGESLSYRLARQAAAMHKRHGRRRVFAESIPEREPGLW